MLELQWDRARRAMAESERLVSESTDLRAGVATTLKRTRNLMTGVLQVTPKHLQTLRLRRVPAPPLED